MYQAVRDIVGSKWSLEILSTLYRESPQNFSTINKKFDTSPDVISERLKLLAEYGLIDRVEYSRRDVRYNITDHGITILDRVLRLDNHLSEEYSK